MSLDFRIVVVAEITNAIDAKARRLRSLRLVRDGGVGVAPSGWLIENRYTRPIGPHGDFKLGLLPAGTYRIFLDLIRRSVD